MTTRSNAFFVGLIEDKQEEHFPTKDVHMQTNAYSYTTIYRKFRCDVIHAPLKPLSTPRLYE